MFNLKERNDLIFQDSDLKGLEKKNGLKSFSLSLEQIEILVEKGYLELEKTQAPLNREIFQEMLSLKEKCEIEFKGYVMLQNHVIDIDSINMKGHIPKKMVEYWLRIILLTKPKDFKISPHRISAWWSKNEGTSKTIVNRSRLSLF